MWAINANLLILECASHDTLDGLWSTTQLHRLVSGIHEAAEKLLSVVLLRTVHPLIPEPVVKENGNQ